MTNLFDEMMKRKADADRDAVALMRAMSITKSFEDIAYIVGEYEDEEVFLLGGMADLCVMLLKEIEAATNISREEILDAVTKRLLENELAG